MRASGTYLGHGFEPQFPMNIALATLALGHDKLFPPGDVLGVEQAMAAELRQVVVTSVGHWRGERRSFLARSAIMPKPRREAAASLPGG